MQAGIEKRSVQTHYYEIEPCPKEVKKGEISMAIYEITPVPKPRMSKRDKWKKRPCVMRYWQFCDEVRLARVELPFYGAKIVFRIPMPDSWSAAKKANSDGTPHQQRPDLTNLAKAIEDACYGEDAAIWHYSGLEKRWGYKGAIEITY